MVIYSFLFFLIGFVVIGAASALKSRRTNDDYILASRSMPPAVTALTAFATCNSGYMFIGAIGYTYLFGLHSAWFLIGSMVGDYIGSIFVHKRLRKVTEERKALSFASALSGWQGKDFKWVRILAAAITVIFLCVYAAAQFKAGSKALHALFGWDYRTGAVIGSVIVFIYCLSGGIRASIWTDVAQSLVMVFAMGMLLFVGIGEVGGFGAFWQQLEGISPYYTDFFPDKTFLGIILFILSCFISGFATIGQPHVMTRFMTVDHTSNVGRARAWYYFWTVIFYSLATCVALVARLLLPEYLGGIEFDAELALPMMGKAILPEVLVGVVLAGVFAASMSTADSQILTCSAAFTQDLFTSQKRSLLISKVITLALGIAALFISISDGKSVFDLVIIAWGTMGSVFGPLLFMLAWGKKVSQSLALTMMVAGGFVAIAWRVAGLVPIAFEVGPGMLTGFIIYFAHSFFSRR